MHMRRAQRAAPSPPPLPGRFDFESLSTGCARGMAERDWKRRWMDPTLLGRRWRWYMTACALSLVAIYLLVGPYPVDVGRYGPRLCLGLIVSFVLGAMYAARWHRRIATQAKEADHQMCKFCGYGFK